MTPMPTIQPHGSCDTYHATLKEILATEDIKARLLDPGIEVRSETPVEMKECLRSHIEKVGIPKQ